MLGLVSCVAVFYFVLELSYACLLRKLSEDRSIEGILRLHMYWPRVKFYVSFFIARSPTLNGLR
jgi:hypothetical protein